MWLVMLVTKLTTSFRLQTYVDAINVEYIIRHFWFCNILVIGNKLACMINIGLRQFPLKFSVIIWILRKNKIL